MRRWLITGVSSGFGRALAQAALEAGDIVCGTVRKAADVDAFSQLAPGRAHPVVMDVTDAVSVSAGVAQAEAIMGCIDVLVNNAGRGLTGAIEETGLDEARALFETNVFGPLAVLQAALPPMRARRQGAVINVTSVSGLAAWHGTGIYGATKFALECIGRTLAQELAPLGISVTNVAPGGLRTSFAAPDLADAGNQISDYCGTAHVARAVLRSKHGHEPGDPAKAARAVLAALDSGEPPLLLLLGDDAVGYASAELDMLKDQISRWESLSRSSAAED